MSTSERKNKFVLFAQGRSGSALLRDLLNAHPDVYCDGEIFVLDKNHIKAQQMSKLIRKYPVEYVGTQSQFTRKSFYGFTFMDYHLPDPEQLIKNLYISDWKIIYVSRNDILNQCFSNLVAEKSNFYHRKSDDPSPNKRFHISKERLIDELNWWKQRREKEESILKGINSHRIIYEEHLQDQNKWAQTTQNLFEYIGAKPSPVTSNLKKTYNKQYSEIIENYNELIEMLKTSSFAHFLKYHF